MNLKKTAERLDRLVDKPDCSLTLRRIASDLARELPRGEVEILRSFNECVRNALDRLDKGSGAAYARGGLESMREIAVTVDLEHLALQERQDLAAATAKGTVLRSVLESLYGRTRTLTAIAAELGKDKAQISRAVKSLTELQFLQEIALRKPHDGREKHLKLTLKGLSFLRKNGVTRVPQHAEQSRKELFGLSRSSRGRTVKLRSLAHQSDGVIVGRSGTRLYGTAFSASGYKRDANNLKISVSVQSEGAYPPNTDSTNADFHFGNRARRSQPVHRG